MVAKSTPAFRKKMAVLCRKEWGWIRFSCSVRVALTAVQPDLMRRIGANVARPQIEYLLNAGPRVEHQCKQGIVALTPWR